ncbi:MAG: 4a-hydroxytetrahydrobiopterin dehydratase [Actinobacteria bacterium]|uniref:4a-hydroxytetrahydrobiopterin dehydratase n=1 Tax=freshwater metagenome TaxID=449393 RepID=A0A6J6GPT8_9ZZZZ|nr:4a-hydroxytetrahydrobiopterin dehydratase [Actinomycetota bacterium]MSW33285.1 4a-hydroxytetrahydrobiopterin dehydratase [Actinomycetota bacterium]MSX95784.1 4a-hydroxytetrahydrobiopterin dehydratase [Actinomycetota bacterium]MSY25161.1 4a-hydroxytetrahydrobiopterin dehydratase [Actinomycetota bacterium]MSZ52491.1 4a-hydroxytetrahydrobiopterin dehydratase [Actinomycetota bacterium]
MSPRDRVLSAEEVADRLASIPDWKMVDGHLHREFTYANFAEAWAFMNRVAPIAEELDHHPNWSNVWNSVVIDITSHDSGGPTERCFALAKGIDGVVSI